MDRRSCRVTKPMDRALARIIHPLTSPMRTARFGCWAALILFLAPRASAAQCSPPVCAPGEDHGSRVFQSAAINAGLGGLTGGTLAALRGGSFVRGFVQGAAGGGLVHAGKVIAAEQWTGAGLLGRQVASVGASVSMNAAERRSPLALVALPVGPLRLYVENGARVHARVDVSSLIAIASFAAEEGARVDWAATASDGTLVFTRSQGDEAMRGWHRAGIIGYRRRAGSEPLPATTEEEARAHERVHMIQHDQGFLLWGRPIENVLLPRRGRVVGWIDLGVNSLLTSVGNHLIEHEVRPWEREAYLLSEVQEPDDGGPILLDRP
jgi:hypothetical protein